MPPPSAPPGFVTWSMPKRNPKIVFKDYNPNQLLLLSSSLEDFISPNHPVRVVIQVIDSIDIDPLLTKYRGEGC